MVSIKIDDRKNKNVYAIFNDIFFIFFINPPCIKICIFHIKYELLNAKVYDILILVYGRD